jgi:ribosomal-protein-alanine N-acetyltransferase
MELELYDHNRSLSEESLDELSCIDAKDFPFPWTKVQWQQELSKSTTLLGVGKDNGKTIGFCLFHFSPIEQIGHLIKILVLPSVRSKGFAACLHEFVASEVKNRSANSLYLEVSVNNQAAIKFYQKLGYKNLVIKKKFYSNGDDAYAMQKILK